MTGRTRKKQSFTGFFLKRFVPMLIIGAVICFIGTIMLTNMIWAENEAMSWYEFSSAKAAILETGMNGAPETVMRFRTAVYADHYTDEIMGTQKAMVIADPDTGEIVTNSGFALFAFCKTEGEEDRTVYICEDKAVLDFCIENNSISSIFHFDEIYVKDGSFLPANIQVMEYDDPEFEKEIGIAAEKDFTPADKENYEHYEGGILCICVGTLPDSPVLAKLTEAVEGKPIDEAREALDDMYLYEDYILNAEYDTLTYGGREYAMYGLAEYDLWAHVGKYFIIGYIAVFVIILVASLIWAKLSHTKYSAKFESDELRRTMVDALAHDLKSPLTAVSGYAENLASGTHPEKSAHYTSAILENVEYMNSIITSTLELSKTENCSAVHKEQLDITALVKELYEKYRPQAESKGITCRIEGSCTVSADRVLTSQAVENLLTNAVKFTDNGGSISVKADAKGLTVTNSCADTSGIAKLDLTAPFVKGNESRTDRTGSGMGLAIAKSACERQGFRLEVKTEGKSFTAQIRI